MWAVNVTVSGNNYSKMALFCQFMNMRPVSTSSFDRINGTYVNPVVKVHWEKLLADTHSELKDKHLVLAGDARCDSPGFSGMFKLFFAVMS